jgi:hypothetical protein
MDIGGSFRGGQSGRGMNLTTHPHLVPKSKNEWSYTVIPLIRLHGVVLSEAQGQLYFNYFLYFEKKSI